MLYFWLLHGYGYGTKISQRLGSMVLISNSGHQLWDCFVAESMMRPFSKWLTEWWPKVSAFCTDTIRGCRRQIDSCIGGDTLSWSITAFPGLICWRLENMTLAIGIWRLWKAHRLTTHQSPDSIFCHVIAADMSQKLSCKQVLEHPPVILINRWRWCEWQFVGQNLGDIAKRRRSMNRTKNKQPQAHDQLTNRLVRARRHSVQPTTA